MRAHEFIIEFREPDFEEGWKDWAASAAIGAAALGGGTAAAAKQPTAPVAKVTPATQKAPAPVSNIAHTVVKPEARALIKAGVGAGMKGAELAQFVAQCAHETANFTQMKEVGGKLDFKKYDPTTNPRKAKMLGNKVAGDGARYHGRGYIQLTGRDNYARAGAALGLPLEKHPELVERPEIAAKVAVWFWQNHVVPKVNNFNDTASVTKPINSGLHGLANRENTFAAIMQLMKRT
jgi:predicted chitinase